MTSTNRSRVALALLACVSLVLVTTVNRTAGRLFPGLPWLPDSCAASLLVCLVVYLAIRPRRPFAPPAASTNWRRVVQIAALWLGLWFAGSLVAALVHGHWIRYRLAHGPAQLAGFLLWGPIQEELLFRGAIYELAERSRFGEGSRWPVLISTTFFALHHFQLHGFALSPAALGQVAFAVPMGIVFGALRAESESLWPGLAVHVITNLPGAIGA